MDNRIRKYIEKQNMLESGDTVVVGVSGGPDSLCLLYVLFLLKDIFQIQLVCAHVDHQARAKDSEADARFVQQVCAQYGIPFECKRVDVKKIAKGRKENFHQVARDCRYNFFQETMQKYGANKLAIAHHGEDLAETFMMRVVKQSAYESWATLLPKRDFAGGMLIRPLLQQRKQEILNYLHEKKLSFRIDCSNDETYYTRNRFRKYMMPFIYQENPNFLEGLFRTQQDILADEAYLIEQAKQAFEQVVELQKEDEIFLNVDTLLSLPYSLQRRVIQVVLEYLYFYRNLSFSHTYTTEILKRFKQESGYLEMQLADGVYVTVNYKKARIGVGLPSETGAYEVMIYGEGVYSLPNGCSIRVSKVSSLSSHQCKDDYWIDGAHAQFPYIIRTRRMGDQIALPKAAGHKKINRLFIDEKVPLPKRSSWPILVQQDGQILWVPLLKKVRLPKQIEQQEVFYIFQYIAEETEEVQL